MENKIILQVRVIERRGRPQRRIATEAGAQRKSDGDRRSTGGQKQVGKKEVSEE